MGRRSGAQALATLGPSSSRSPPTFSHQSWQQGPLCGIVCDRGCTCGLRLCPTGTQGTAQHPLESVDQVLMGWPGGSEQGQGGPGNSELGRKSPSSIKETLGNSLPVQW